MNAVLPVQTTFMAELLTSVLVAGHVLPCNGWMGLL